MQTPPPPLSPEQQLTNAGLDPIIVAQLSAQRVIYNSPING